MPLEFHKAIPHQLPFPLVHFYKSWSAFYASERNRARTFVDLCGVVLIEPGMGDATCGRGCILASVDFEKAGRSASASLNVGAVSGRSWDMERFV